MDYVVKYKNALERATAAYKDEDEDKHLKATLERIFPELEESNGERIRKFLHHTFTAQYLAQDKLGKWHGEPVSNILAWLEKQKPSDAALEYLKENHSPSEVSDFQAAMNIAVAKAYDRGRADAIAEMRKQDNDSYLQEKIDAFTNAHKGEDPEDIIAACRGYERQGEQKPSMEGTFVNVDEVREDFMREVYRVLDADPTNDRANQIIDAFDHLPTVVIQNAEWGEEDEMRVKHLIGFVEKYGLNYCNIDKIISWLKSLRPQPHWKPSDEQMADLWNMVCECRPADQQLLQDIYYGLKTLKEE